MRQIHFVLLYNILHNSRVLIKIQFFVILSVVLSCTTDYFSTASYATTYYVSSKGRDTNPGTSMNSAWATLEKVNGTDFLPGDKVLFEAGSTFSGKLTFISKSGLAGKRIIVSSYGSGRAMINGGDGVAFLNTGSNYMTVRNIDFIGSGRKAGNITAGISLSKASHTVLDSCSVSGFQKAGLNISNCDSSSFTYINAHDNGSAGIYAGGGSNLYFGYCRADNNPGDPTNLTNHSGNGILIGGNQINHCLVEYCEASDNGWDMPRGGNGPAGIWCYDASYITFQYCLAHHNKTSANGGDGDGFDMDGGSTNCTIQYCLAYSNMGPGFLLCEYSRSNTWENNTLRYNISINDATKNGGTGILFWYTGGGTNFKNAFIFNNLVYNNLDNAIWFHDPCPGSRISNNIFIFKNKAFNGTYSSADFSGNCYWKIGGGFNCDSITDFTTWANKKDKEKVNGVIVGMNSDPLLDLPSIISLTITDPTKLKTLTQFMLQANSPCINKGMNLKQLYNIDPGKYDFFGISIQASKTFNIGPCEH